MASASARTAGDLRDSVKSFLDRLLEADVSEQIARTGREMAEAVADATQDAAERAADAWNDSRGERQKAEKVIRRAGRNAADWSSDAWRRELRPRLRDLWKQRTVAIGAAGAALPASRELFDTAKERLGLKPRDERHWGAFFLGLLVGAAAGVIVAMLTAPKTGREMRSELASRAREASDWVPMFQRETTEDVNGSQPTPIERPPRRRAKQGEAG
jgi:gas vesicle protein